MKSRSKKRIGIIASLTAVLVLLIVAGVLVALEITRKPVRGQKSTISAVDLAEMKTLTYEYLNERIRALISAEPDNDPNIAGAPIISPSDMSPDLAKRQKEDVEKLEAGTHLGTFKNFAVLAHLLDLQEEGNKVVLHLGETTYFQLSQSGPPDSAEADDRYFTFSRVGGRWILTDVKLPYAGTMPSDIEPSVKPMEAGTDRVLANPPKQTSVIPAEIQKLDSEAMEKIKSKWAIDDRTGQAIESGMYSW